jgi:hypothetical protein
MKRCRGANFRALPNGSSALGSRLVVSYKVKHTFSWNPVILHLRIYSKEMKTYVHPKTWTWMLKAVLLIIATAGYNPNDHRQVHSDSAIKTHQCATMSSLVLKSIMSGERCRCCTAKPARCQGFKPHSWSQLFYQGAWLYSWMSSDSSQSSRFSSRTHFRSQAGCRAELGSCPSGDWDHIPTGCWLKLPSFLALWSFSSHSQLISWKADAQDVPARFKLQPLWMNPAIPQCSWLSLQATGSIPHTGKQTTRTNRQDLGSCRERPMSFPYFRKGEAVVKEDR